MSLACCLHRQTRLGNDMGGWRDLNVLVYLVKINLLLEVMRKVYRASLCRMINAFVRPSSCEALTSLGAGDSSLPSAFGAERIAATD